MYVHHSLEVGKAILVCNKLVEGIGSLYHTANVHSNTDRGHQGGQHLIVVPELFEKLFAMFADLQRDVNPGINNHQEQQALEHNICFDYQIIQTSTGLNK